jgi:hypothetical protein
MNNATLIDFIGTPSLLSYWPLANIVATGMDLVAILLMMGIVIGMQDLSTRSAPLTYVGGV